MKREYAHIRVETIDKTEPPTGNNIRIYLNDVDISATTKGIEVRAMVHELSRVTLHLYANVDIDGLVVSGGGK